jgi:polyphosphate kinase 2 (PPK2 family)
LTLLSSAAEKGGLTAVNLLGNSRVDINGPAGAQQQQQQQKTEQQSEQPSDLQQSEQQQSEPQQSEPGEQQQEQQEQQGEGPLEQKQEQEQQQGRRVTVLVEPRPVGGHQGHPCRMLHVVLLLPDKSKYQQG